VPGYGLNWSALAAPASRLRDAAAATSGVMILGPPRGIWRPLLAEYAYATRVIC
jgi:hypothetical protein